MAQIALNQPDETDSSLVFVPDVPHEGSSAPAPPIRHSANGYLDAMESDIRIGLFQTVPAGPLPMPRNSAGLVKALNDIGQREQLTLNDRAHLKTWGKRASDPIWDDLAAKIAAHGVFPTDPLYFVVDHAIYARHTAEATSTPNPKREPQAHEREQARLLELADSMEELVKAYLAHPAAHQKGGAPPPEADLATYEDPAVALRKQSLAWLQKDAQRIRELAARKPTITDDIGLMWEVRVRRQKKGTKRSNAGAISIFVQDMAGLVKKVTGKPLWRAVAALTNVAFPLADVGEDDVRSMCKATTRTGRQKKPVHSGVGDGKKTP